MARAPKGLTFRVFLLVGLAFLPAVLLYVYASQALRDLRAQTHHEELVRAAAVAQVQYDGLITRSRALLASLAEFDEIRSGRQPECNERLAAVLGHNPEYTTISVIGLDGYLACGSLPVDGELFLGDRAYFNWAISGRRFAMGEYAIGRITGRPGVGMALPIEGNGDVTGVLATTVDLTLLGQQALDASLPEGATFTVLDRHGTILVRRPAPLGSPAADTLGARVGEAFPAMPVSRRPEVVPGTDPYGFQRLYAVAPLTAGAGPPQGYLAIGTLEGALMEDVDSVVESQLRWLMLAGLVLVVLAWVAGHYWFVRSPRTA